MFLSKSFLFGLVVLFGGIASGGPAAAQDAALATPPVAPDPAECRVEPRPADLFDQLAAAPADAAATPTVAQSPTPFLLPAGDPPPADAEAAAVATVREAIACRNAGDAGRLAALYTDTYLARLAALPPEERGPLATFGQEANPVPEESRITLLLVEEVRSLADGVGVLVSIDDPATEIGGPERLFAVLREEGGRYLIDEETYPDAGSVATPPA
jgi:hypothetical protein